MSYDAGILTKRVTVLNPPAQIETAYGFKPGTEWKEEKTVWASVKWVKGMKPLQEGAVDVYDVIMVRMMWNPFTSRRSRLKIKDKLYEVDTFNDSKRENEIQITAHEIVNPK